MKKNTLVTTNENGKTTTTQLSASNVVALMTEYISNAFTYPERFTYAADGVTGEHGENLIAHVITDALTKISYTFVKEF